MRLPRGTNIRVDPKMKSKRPANEPDAAALREIGRLGFFHETENAGVESPRLEFLPFRHGELHVIESDYFSQGQSSPGSAT